MTGRVPVTFLPSGAVVWVAPGGTLLSASRLAGVPIEAPCAGRGVCGGCGVKVIEGRLGEVEPDERAALGNAPPGVRLACRARVREAVTVRPVISHTVVGGRRVPAATGPLAAGVDLGTTNVSARVIERESGREVGDATVPNTQRAFGADVMSRLAAALEGDEARLRQLAATSVVEALKAAAGEHASGIERVVVAGNTVMAALLTGAPVDSLAHAPFVAPAPVEDPNLSEIADVIAPNAAIHVLDGIASFVGGDLRAGLFSLDVVSACGPVMLVDIGTNAEVALWHGGHLTVASAPAGPAFEGVGIAVGGPAVPGAVVAVSVGGGSVSLETIDRAPARWFCGAGLVSVMAALRETGHLDADGTLTESGPLASRFERDGDGVLLVDFGTAETRLLLSQLDLRTLQLAKAAVRVAIEGVLGAAQVRADAVQRLWVAGAFGGALRANDLVALGMVPAATASVVESAGNTSLAGAAALALEMHGAERARELTRAVRAVDLVSTLGFSDSLMRAVELAPFDA